jgi:hypothetical protein
MTGVGLPRTQRITERTAEDEKNHRQFCPAHVGHVAFRRPSCRSRACSMHPEKLDAVGTAGW